MRLRHARHQGDGADSVRASLSGSPLGSWLVPLVAGVVLALLVSVDVALTMAPALALVAVLLTGRRPGEALIDRWRTQPSRSPARRAPLRCGLPELSLVVRPVGGRFAAALAMRPPPRTACCVA